MPYEEFLAEEERKRQEGEYDAPPVATIDQPPPAPPPQDQGESFGEFVGRRSIPFASSLYEFSRANDYAQAKQRLAEGLNYHGDYGIVAAHEAQQQQDAARGTGGQILAGLAAIPAMAGEAYAGGAVLGRVAPALSTASTLSARGAGRIAASTAMAPSFFLPQAAQRAAENGGQWYEPQNLGVAGLMGMGQMAVLGSLPQFANGIRGTGAASIAARLGVRTVAGMGEQQIFDAVGGAVDNILPEAYQTRTRYGLLGDAMRGEWGHFWQHAAVQATTFAAFSALHPGPHGEEPVAPTPAPLEPYGPPRPAELSPQRPEGPRPMSEPTQMPGFMRPHFIPEAPARAGLSPGATHTAGPLFEGRSVDVPLPGQVATRFSDPTSRMPSADFAPIPLSRGINTIDAISIASEALHNNGQRTRSEVGQILSRVTDAVQKELAKKGSLSPQEANAFVDAMKLPAAAKAYADSLFEAANRPGVPKPPLPGEREAARGARGEAELNPKAVPPEILSQVNPPPLRELAASPTGRPGFHPEPGRQFSPKDEIGQAMLAKRLEKRSIPQFSETLPRPRTEPTQLPGFMRPPEGPPRPPEPPKAPVAPEPVKFKPGGPLEKIGGLAAKFGDTVMHVMASPKDSTIGFITGLKGKDVAGKMSEIIKALKEQGFRDIQYRPDAEDGRSAARIRLFESLRRRFGQEAPEAPKGLEAAQKAPPVAKITPEVRAEFERKLAEAGLPAATLSEKQAKVQQERLAAGLPVREPSGLVAHGPRTGENPIPEHIAEAIDKANLPSHEKAAIEGWLQGNSLRALERPLGVSRTEVQNRAREAWQKIIEHDPELAKKYPAFTDYVHETKRAEVADLLNGPVTGERATRADAVLEEVYQHEEVLRQEQKENARKIRAAENAQETASAADVANYRSAGLGERASKMAELAPRQTERLSQGARGLSAEPAVSGRSSGPITPERIKEVSDLSPNHAALVGKMRDTIMKSPLPIEQKVQYLHNQLDMLSRMPARAAALHNASLGQTNFHPSTAALMESLARTSPEVRAAIKAGDEVGGAYNRGTRVQTLDGETESYSAVRVAGHEAGHVIDGPQEIISNSPDVKNAYLKEALKGTIGEMARIDPHEFLGEVTGLIYSGEMTPADLKAKMPLMYEAMLSRELIHPAEGVSRFEKPKDVFSHAINDGPLHMDILAERLHAAPREKPLADKAEEAAKFALGQTTRTISSRATEKVAAMRDSVWASARGALDHLAQLSGKAFVNTTRASQPLGEAMGRYVASRTWVKEAMPDLIDRVIGPKANERFRHEAGAALMEMSMREYKARLMEQGKLEKADAIRTFVKDRLNSTTNAVFENDHAYHTFINSAEGKRVIEAYKKHVTPELHELWRRYKSGEGELSDADPIIGPSQIPDMPINFMRINEGDINSPFYAGGGRGNLKNPQQGKLVFDKDATRAHPQYETDLAKIMENSFNKTVEVANKRAMYNQAISDGLAQKGPSGGRGTLPNGDKVWEIPKVYGDGHSLYVSERIASEMRQAVSPDKPQSIPFVSDAAKVLNRAMGAALAEPVSHLKNQLTALMQAGVNPLEMIPKALGVIRGDSAIQKQILELAKINAFRGGHGLESGQLWGGKYDPTHWVGKLINVMDAAARLTLKSGYERNVRLGRTQASETGLRDFVNQGLGDYNKLSQHKLVVLLRDLGIGPFATAGTKFYTSGMRLLTLDPGVKATSTTQAIAMRAEILAKLVAVVGAVALANKALWKNNLGDDDTPLGAIKTGKTPDGKSTYFDLTAFTGLTRGFRQTGLLALGEGLRQGSSPQRITDRGMEAFFTNLMHPMEGPVVNFAHTLITGRDSFGRDVIPPESAGGSRAIESLRAAAIQSNPFAAAALGHDKKAQDMTFGARVADLLGPFNPFKERGDQRLGELRGRLRELEDLRRAFYTSPENTSRPFAREAEYRVLRRFDEAVGKLNNVISGTVSTQQGRRSIERPESARIRELRQQVTDLAQQAMQTQRQYQTR